VLRLAGAAYLVYLGVRSLWRAFSRHTPAGGQVGERGRSADTVAAFWQGCLSNLSNVKMAVFFMSLLPQFAAPHASFGMLLALGLNFSLLTIAWLCGYAFAVERMSRVLLRPLVRRSTDALLGTVLAGVGLRVGAEAVRS
jgi:threonine/homoserine/homoserine lactone efflux protein